MIVLVGFMGSGKSTVGSALADRLHLPFVDADAEIEQRAGASAHEIFELYGEEGFRQFERGVVAEFVDGPAAVVALGGGALGDASTRELLAGLPDARVVYLRVSFDEAMYRVGGDANRPMLKERDPRSLYDEREAIYEKIASLVVETGGRSPDSIAHEIAARLALETVKPRPEPPAPHKEAPVRRITVDAPSRTYEVVVGEGVSARLSDFVFLEGAEAAFVVTHPSLVPLTRPAIISLETAGLRAGVVEIPEGETAKSLATTESIFNRLAEASAHRGDLVVGFGGGVVTDVAGFVASTFNRGMPLVHAPTTLLAQVDAAIGGKTGVNLPEGKNLIGTFYQPSAVVCDVGLLRGLPEAELRAGLAEVVKYGLIARPGMLDLIERDAGRIFAADPHTLTEVVAESVETKAEIVGADEHERGRRAHLNYGHTFAHAIERAAGYGQLRHGEAVAIGMMAAAYLAEQLGRLDHAGVQRHRKILESVGLPVTATLDVDELYDSWQRDKKYRHGVRFVLLSGIGAPHAGVTAPREAVVAAVERLRE